MSFDGARVALVSSLCFSALAAISCASGGGSPGTRESARNEALISLAEIENAHQPTLYDLVRAVRPTWLRQSPATVRSGQDDGITVFLDDQRAGSIDVLSQLPSSAASSLRFYSPSEAQSRFGLGNLHGVIQIVSARGAARH